MPRRWSALELETLEEFEERILAIRRDDGPRFGRCPRRHAWPSACFGAPGFRTFMYGLGLYAVLTLATAATENIHLVPSVLMLGALSVPVTFVVYVFERLPRWRRAPAVARDLLRGRRPWRHRRSGGPRYETLADLGGAADVSLWVLSRKASSSRSRWCCSSGGASSTRPPASSSASPPGMGFASFESMGYGLAQLIQLAWRARAHRGSLATRRGLASPAGHAAWTGLVCAALWQARARGPRPRAWAPVAAAFGLAVPAAHAVGRSPTRPASAPRFAAVSIALLNRPPLPSADSVRATATSTRSTG